MCLANGVIAKGEGLPCPLDAEGRFVDPVTDFKGLYVKVCVCRGALGQGQGRGRGWAGVGQGLCQCGSACRRDAFAGGSKESDKRSLLMGRS